MWANCFVARKGSNIEVLPRAHSKCVFGFCMPFKRKTKKVFLQNDPRKRVWAFLGETLEKSIEMRYTARNGSKRAR